MELAAAMICFNFAIILIALVFGAVAVVRGKVQLTRSRTLRGHAARIAGIMCIVVAIVFWWFSVSMWSLYDR